MQLPRSTCLPILSLFPVTPGSCALLGTANREDELEFIAFDPYSPILSSGSRRICFPSSEEGNLWPEQVWLPIFVRDEGRVLDRQSNKPLGILPLGCETREAITGRQLGAHK